MIRGPLLLAALTIYCFNSTASTTPGSPDQSPAPTENSDTSDKDKSYDIEDWYAEFSRQWEKETRYLRVRATFPEWYHSQSQRELYEASFFGQKVEEKLIDDFEDSVMDATTEWFWQTEFGKSIEEKADNIGGRLELSRREEEGPDSKKHTALGFLFGDKSEGWPDLGFRFGEKPELVLEYTGKSTRRFTYDDNGQRVPIRLEHEWSFRIGDLTKFGDYAEAMRFGYELDNIFGFINLNAYYYVTDQRFAVYFSDIPITDSSWVRFGVGYNFKGGSYEDFMYERHEFGNGTLFVTAGYYGSFQKITDLFKMKRQDKLAEQKQRQERLRRIAMLNSKH